MSFLRSLGFNVLRLCRRNATTTPAASSSTSSNVRRVRVYTRTGDKGTSSLFNMQRLGKDSEYFQAMGNVDELNAHIGVARSQIMATETVLAARLEEIQSRLFDVGAHIATPRTQSSPNQLERTQIDDAWIDQLEEWIDEMDDTLEPLRNFVLPSGDPGACSLHVCRAVCRRAERSMVPLVQKADADAVALRYLNRLSDFFFVCARYVNDHRGVHEVIWKKPRRSEKKEAAAATSDPTDAASTSTSPSSSSPSSSSSSSASKKDS